VKNSSEKIESTVSEKRVKLHVFEPSNRKIWTVIGKEKEYWIDPNLGYCSCPGYYFGKLNDKDGCYHLESVKLAQKEDKVEKIIFADEEYGDFIFSIVCGL